MRGRFRFVKDQVGYKLAALLETRATMAPSTLEYMFGDDAEADAFIYSMFSDICAGRVDTATLMRVLELSGVYPDVVPRIVRLAETVPRSPSPAVRIFIHLERVTAPSAFSEFGPRVCPFYNYFQPALILLEHGVLPPLSVLRVAAELVIHHGFTADALCASYTDLAGRGQLGRRAADVLVPFTRDVDDSLLATTGPVLRAFARRLEGELAQDIPDVPILNDPPEIQWEALFVEDRTRARSMKMRTMGRSVDGNKRRR